MMPKVSRPTPVLVLAGLDPSSGAGLSADLEAIRSAGGWALTVATALTVQDSVNVAGVTEVAADYIRAAADTVCQDISPQAIKVGLLAGGESLSAVVDILTRWHGVPVVIDPVLKAGGGASLTTEALVARYRSELLPMATMVTPNRMELARLVPELGDDDARAGKLSNEGPAVLLTGTDPLPGELPSTSVVHRLYCQGSLVQEWQWPRLDGSYHGSGCTLAARLALLLARQESLANASEKAQCYTLETLRAAYRIGHGQRLPNRFSGGSQG